MLTEKQKSQEITALTVFFKEERKLEFRDAISVLMGWLTHSRVRVIFIRKPDTKQAGFSS